MHQAAPDQDDPYLGLLIANALRLEELIGCGTTGRVYRATQLALGRTVCVKILHRFLMQTPGVKERFHREARLLAVLTHPGILRVMGSGELETISPEQGGETFIVFEYLKGNTLREILQISKRMSQTQAVSIVLEVAEAVSLAHTRRIIHRDLKPENLMLARRNNDEARYVVLDFGLSRALDSETCPLTRAGAILGTPQYMSPEAARGDSCTPASDVYALATILYELLAGHAPFSGGSPVAVLAQQASSPSPPLDPSLNVSGPLEEFIFANLEKEPSLRCEDAGAFRAGLLQTTLQTRESSETMGKPSGTSSGRLASLEGFLVSK